MIGFRYVRQILKVTNNILKLVILFTPVSDPSFMHLHKYGIIPAYDLCKKSYQQSDELSLAQLHNLTLSMSNIKGKIHGYMFYREIIELEVSLSISFM